MNNASRRNMNECFIRHMLQTDVPGNSKGRTNTDDGVKPTRNQLLIEGLRTSRMNGYLHCRRNVTKMHHDVGNIILQSRGDRPKAVGATEAILYDLGFQMARIPNQRTHPGQHPQAIRRRLDSTSRANEELRPEIPLKDRDPLANGGTCEPLMAGRPAIEPVSTTASKLSRNRVSKFFPSLRETKR